MKCRIVVLGFGFAVLAGALSGCSSAGPSGGPRLAVEGSVSQAVHVDDARAVAIGTDGRTFWAYLDAQRDFTLMLPVGQSYRIVVANAREGGGEAIVGHLVVPATSGTTEWLGANEPGTVDLGTLLLQSERTPESARHDHGDSDHADDNQCHEGGHHGGGDGDGVCSDGDDAPLSATKNPGSKCDDHDHHTHPGHHGNHCDGGKDDDHDGGGDDDGDDPPCPHGDGGHADDAGHASDGGSSSDAGGGGGVGAECLTSADCAAHLSCIAGLCTATAAE